MTAKTVVNFNNPHDINGHEYRSGQVYQVHHDGQHILVMLDYDNDCAMILTGRNVGDFISTLDLNLSSDNMIKEMTITIENY